MLYVIYICDFFFFWATWTSIVRFGQISIFQYEGRSDVEFEWELESSHCDYVKMILLQISHCVCFKLYFVSLMFACTDGPI